MVKVRVKDLGKVKVQVKEMVKVRVKGRVKVRVKEMVKRMMASLEHHLFLYSFHQHELLDRQTDYGVD